MTELESEKTLWQSKNKRLLLTSHRLREEYKSFKGSRIKSIMLDQISSCELRTTSQPRFLRQAVMYFLAINGTVYLLNNFLFKAELVRIFFGEIHIEAESAQVIFYLSVAIVLAYLVRFIRSIKEVFSFNSVGMTIDFQLRWLDFEERESFISLVENAKDRRLRDLHSCQK